MVIEALKDFPDNVIAVACHGHVTKADYETVVIPDIEDKLEVVPVFVELEVAVPHLRPAGW